MSENSHKLIDLDQMEQSLRAVKFTHYFQTIHQRPDRSVIQLEWIQRVVENPVKQIVQNDGRIRRWAPIAEMQGGIYALYCCQMEKLYITRFLTGHSSHENQILRGY